jgi:hypothetical protein
MDTQHAGPGSEDPRDRRGFDRRGFDRRRSGSSLAFPPSEVEVLAFLADLRVDRSRCHALSSGPRLFHEAADAGLVGEDEVELFVAQLVGLRDHGLADWTPARGDVRGDDVVHAAEFHVTLEGRRRLEALSG